MKHILTLTLIAAALALSSIADLSAQVSVQVRWGSAPVPTAGACFYQHINFGGQYFCVRPGQTVGSLSRGMDREISSIRLFGRNEVTVFQRPRFRGRTARFDTDVRDLRFQGWNDAISSFRVNASSWGGAPPSWGNPAMPREGACFYKAENFLGPHFCVPRGGSFAQFPQGFNDQIVSVRVIRSVVMIFENRDYGGRFARITRNTNLRRGTWGSNISSLRVF